MFVHCIVKKKSIKSVLRIAPETLHFFLEQRYVELDLFG